jgi:dephospho-CoA kinase
MILGLTGGYCAGKNLVARLLAERGWAACDVDVLGHAALESRLPEVAELLGPGILRPDGSPDRREIGRRVFADPALLARYETVVHPALIALVDGVIRDSGDRDLCLNAAILYKLPQAARCAAVLEVRSPLTARIRRGRTRDGLSTGAILDRIRRQRPLWARRREYPGPVLVLRNSGSEALLARRLDAALARLGRGRPSSSQAP